MANVKEVKYYEKLNIDIKSIGDIKLMIKSDITNTINAWDKGKNVERQSFHIIGPAGVGKTAIMDQIKSELSQELNKEFHMIMIKAPVISRDDMLIPFPIKDSKKFEMLYSDFIPPDDQEYGLFVIDEFMRGDRVLKQLLWQIQNEQKIHMKSFPKGWFVVSTDNPDDDEYSLDSDEDAAGLRRHLHVYVDVSAKDFIKYAESNQLHPLVINYIKTYPDRVYDFKSQKIGAVYSNPASWEKVSDHLWKYELNGGIDKHLNHLSTIISGLINLTNTRMFLSFIRDNSNMLSPEDILNNFDKVKPKLEEYLNKNDNAVISNVMSSFMNYLTDSKPVTDDIQNNNISEFLMMMPIDTAATFVRILDNMDRTSKEFLYITKLQIALTKNVNFRTKFYEPLIRLIR